MTLSLGRLEIESAGSDPVRLATALLKQMPGLDGAVPVEEVALALDIRSIEKAPLRSVAGCLQCDAHKDVGQIVVNGNDPPRRRRYTVAQ